MYGLLRELPTELPSQVDPSCECRDKRWNLLLAVHHLVTRDIGLIVERHTATDNGQHAQEISSVSMLLEHLAQ